MATRLSICNAVMKFLLQEVSSLSKRGIVPLLCCFFMKFVKYCSYINLFFINLLILCPFNSLLLHILYMELIYLKYFKILCFHLEH